jgi:hypothetical protein
MDSDVNLNSTAVSDLPASRSSPQDAGEDGLQDIQECLICRTFTE